MTDKSTDKTTKATWLAMVGIDAKGKRYEPGDTVPQSVSKQKWLRDQGLIRKVGS